MRALRQWAASFANYFPSAQELAENPRYWNWKIPVDSGLVEGRYTTPELQQECAQLLIDACSSLIGAKPEWAKSHRVTCCICLPDIFTSEICIYSDEDYYQGKVSRSSSEYGYQEPIESRSLAAEWGLALPRNATEIGVLWRYDASDSVEDHYVSEHWMYGEVA
jgi:hypothetical protein